MSSTKLSTKLSTKSSKTEEKKILPSKKDKSSKKAEKEITLLKEPLSEKHSWRILSAYFKEKTLVSHQIESFDDFINFGIQSVIDQESTVQYQNYTIKFGHITLLPPHVIEENRNSGSLYPLDARRRELTYDTPIYCDLHETYTNDSGEKESRTFRREMIGRLPVMVKSSLCNLYNLNTDEQCQKGECPNDHGGYFIIKGHERALTGQMRRAYNEVFVLSKGIKKGEKDKYIAEARPISEETGHTVLIRCILGNDDRTLTFSLPYIKEKIPVGIVFKALGFTENEQIISILSLPKEADRYLKFILRDSFLCQTTEQALTYIGRSTLHIVEEGKRSAYAKQVIESELFPHMGITGTNLEYACFLGYMVRQIILTSLGIRQEDDLDNYANKRVEIAGILLHDLFRNIFKKYTQNLKQWLEKRKQRPEIISFISKNKEITKRLHQCLSTGNWSAIKNAAYIRSGVSQVLDRMTYFAATSHLRRIIIPVGKQGKNTAIRQIHGSSFGFVCPAETPEGIKVGIVLNMALLCRFTKKIPSVMIRRILETSMKKYIVFTQDVDVLELKNYIPVFLNNAVIGFTKNPEKVVEKIKNLRQKEKLDSDVSVAYNKSDRVVKLYSDEGRFSRPLLTMKNNSVLLPSMKSYSFSDLLKQDYIRYLDPFEIEHSVLCMNIGKPKNPVNHYCEIHPCTILGIMASLIPFPDHSQSPRNCYSSSMSKQALGIPTLAYNVRVDTKLHVLTYPQKPLVVTRVGKLAGINEMPSGVNALVAIASWGNNQEDSVCLNQSAIERGLFCLTSYHTIEYTEKKKDTYSNYKICLPPLTNPNFKRNISCNYNLLDENGIVRVRHDKGSTYVRKGDVIVGRVIVNGNKAGEETLIDDSRIIQAGEEGYIDRVYVDTTPNGYKIVKVTIRVVRFPTLGDKIASRTAQKGTIGMVYRQEDMPFTCDGVVPDIIINSCCIPSRMTVHQLIESVLGKSVCITGEYADATPFTENSTNVANKLVEKISESIQEYGFESHGWETMYSGTTGERLRARLFFGPTYYQRLKHLIDGKMHVRAHGKVTGLTRQPLEGRAKDGGLRFGEMEKDAMVAHGASRFVKERMFDMSDPFQVTVCKTCGVMTASTQECQVCQTDNVSSVNIPYAAKILMQESAALCLKMVIKPEKN